MEAGARPFYTERPDGRIKHRAEPLMLRMALLVIPAIVLEEAATSLLRTVAWGLNLVIWFAFAAELVFVLSVSRHRLSSGHQNRPHSAHWGIKATHSALGAHGAHGAHGAV